MAAAITRKLVSLTDAADILAVSTKTVRRYIADEHLEAVRLGRKTLRIKLDSIERARRACTAAPTVVSIPARKVALRTHLSAPKLSIEPGSLPWTR